MRPFKYTTANDVREAIQNKNSSNKFLAGGTNLVDLMKKQIEEPEQIIDVNSILSNDIKEGKNGIEIGASVKNSALAKDPLILAKYPLVSKAILKGASQQIRNMASVGGNILQRTRCPYFYDLTTPCNKRKPNSGCSAINGVNRMNAVIGYDNTCVAVHPSDMCVALSALNAKIETIIKDGRTMSFTIDSFMRLPDGKPELDTNLREDSIITRVIIPANSFYKNCSYVKLRDRESYAFALVSVASALELDGTTITEARMVSGGVAHKPWRWNNAERFLQGKTANATTFREAASMISKDIKPLSHNGFKVPMLEGAVITALQECIQS